MPAVSDVVVAGAGIGGLTLAIALERVGIRVRVYERAPELLPVGAGISVQPNAMLALRGLGLAEEIALAGVNIERAAILRPDGRVLSQQDVGALSRSFGAPAVAIHRARLHEILGRALGHDRIATGTAVARFSDAGRSVRVELGSGTAVETELLVGADGLRSAVRAQLIGDGEPTYAGYTSWRGIAHAPDLATSLPSSETWGRGLRFGIVPVSASEIYWFAVADAPPGVRHADMRRELETRFSGWHTPVARLIAETPPERIVHTDIADRTPLPSFQRGCVALLGDAAHPMTPNVGQGACQAIEDAVVLASALAQEGTLEAALARYDHERVARTANIVRQARRVGAVGQWSNPLAVGVRELLMRALPTSATERQMSELWRFAAPS